MWKLIAPGIMLVDFLTPAIAMETTKKHKKFKVLGIG
jgi:hypothetical protein